MKKLKKMSLPELKAYRDLLEIRISELHRYKIDDEFYPPYTDKEIEHIKKLETDAIKALSVINKIIRFKLDEFINSIEYE